MNAYFWARTTSMWLSGKIGSRLHLDERGATAVEYGVMVALIAAVIIAIVATLGKQVNKAFTDVSGKLPAAP